MQPRYPGVPPDEGWYQGQGPSVICYQSITGVPGRGPVTDVTVSSRYVGGTGIMRARDSSDYGGGRAHSFEATYHVMDARERT